MDMHLDPNQDLDSPIPTQFPTPEPQHQSPIHAPSNPEAIISITTGMWESVFARIAKQDAIIESLTMDCHILRQRHATLEREHYDLANSKPKGNSEPKIPDPPMFKGDRTELLPFLTKCQLKFEGQPSQFGNDRAKVLYAGTRLEGTPFS